MSDENVLTKEIAEQFLAEVYGEWLETYFEGYTAIEDSAAESLSKYEGDLTFHITELSDAAAESLSKHKGDLCLYGLTELSDAAAESLSKYEGYYISLNFLTHLSDAAAESFSKHEGSLSFSGLTELSDAAAESLAIRKVSSTTLPCNMAGGGHLRLDLDNLPASAAKILRDAGHG